VQVMQVRALDEAMPQRSSLLFRATGDDKNDTNDRFFSYPLAAAGVAAIVYTLKIFFHSDFKSASFLSFLSFDVVSVCIGAISGDDIFSNPTARFVISVIRRRVNPW